MKFFKSSVILGWIRQSFLLFISLSLLSLGQLRGQNFQGASIPITHDDLAGETVVKILEFKESLYFATKNADGRTVKLWKVNGDLGGVVKVFDITISGGDNLSFLHEFWLFRQNDQYIFFLHDGGTNGLELWRFDGVNAQEVANLDGGGGNSFIRSCCSLDAFPLLHGFGYKDRFYFQTGGRVYRIEGDGTPQRILSEAGGYRVRESYEPKLWLDAGALRLIGDDLLLTSSIRSDGTKLIRLEDGGTFTPPNLPIRGRPFDAGGGRGPSLYGYTAGIWRSGDDVIYAATHYQNANDGIWRFPIPKGGSAQPGTVIRYLDDENLDTSLNAAFDVVRNLRIVPEMDLVFFNYPSSIEYPDATPASKVKGTDELFAANLVTGSMFLVGDYHNSRAEQGERAAFRAVDLYNAVHHDGKAYLILEKGNVRGPSEFPRIPFQLYRTDGSQPDPPVTRGQMGSLEKVDGGALFREQDVPYRITKTSSSSEMSSQSILLYPENPFMISFKDHLYYRKKGGTLHRISNADTMGAEFPASGTEVGYLKIVDNTLYWLAVPEGASNANLQLHSTDGSAVSVLTEIDGGLRALPISSFNGLIFTGGMGASASLVGGIAPKPALEEDVAVAAGGNVGLLPVHPRGGHQEILGRAARRDGNPLGGAGRCRPG